MSRYIPLDVSFASIYSIMFGIFIIIICAVDLFIQPLQPIRLHVFSVFDFEQKDQMLKRVQTEEKNGKR